MGLVEALEEAAAFGGLSLGSADVWQLRRPKGRPCSDHQRDCDYVRAIAVG